MSIRPRELRDAGPRRVGLARARAAQEARVAVRLLPLVADAAVEQQHHACASRGRGRRWVGVRVRAVSCARHTNASYRASHKSLPPNEWMGSASDSSSMFRNPPDSARLIPARGATVVSSGAAPVSTMGQQTSSAVDRACLDDNRASALAWKERCTFSEPELSNKRCQRSVFVLGACELRFLRRGGALRSSRRPPRACGRRDEARRDRRARARGAPGTSVLLRGLSPAASPLCRGGSLRDRCVIHLRRAREARHGTRSRTCVCAGCLPARERASLRRPY